MPISRLIPLVRDSLGREVLPPRLGTVVAAFDGNSPDSTVKPDISPRQR